ncbi:MAG TPA: SIS domain-containing protein [Actinomycetota bacterium]|nr:SIS domain-containing protein [Actinomycetota bacterium]
MSSDRLSAESFFGVATEALEHVERTQLPEIQRAADLLASRLLAGGVVHVFGTGHSEAFAMELAGRAGGLAPFHAMTLQDLAFRGTRSADDVLDPTLERDPAVARELLALHDVRKKDAFVVVSNSGRNGSTVEMARAAGERGLPVVAVTSLDHTRRVSSRHPSGKRLFEVADVVIDNGAPFGDAVLELESGVRVCAVSSLTGAFIAQALTAEITRRYLDAGKEPPVLVSANVDGADERNAELRRRYEGRI